MHEFLHLSLLDWISARQHGDEPVLPTVRQLCHNLGYPLAVAPSFRGAAPSASETEALLEATAQATQLTREALLSQLGDSHLSSLSARGYMPVMRALGRTMFEVLSNLDAFYLTLAKSHPQLRAPSFRPFRTGTTTCDVHYFSSSAGYAVYALATLKSMARALFGIEIAGELAPGHDASCSYDIIRLTMPPSAFPTETAASRSRRLSPSTLPLPASSTDAVFPWHLAFDRNLDVTSLGSSLAKRCGSKLAGRKVYEIIGILRPTDIAGFQFEDYLRYRSAVDFVVKVLSDPQSRARSVSDNAPSRARDCTSILEAVNDPTSLYLKGEMHYIEEQDAMVFLGIPSISGVRQMEVLGLGLRDMPIHSNGRDLIFGAAAQTASVKEAEELSREAAALQADLAEEKRRAEALLHRILPPKMATRLARGEVPPAEVHSAVSVLFSDIVGFTKISSSIHPQLVMDMLNDLFGRFDALCEKHGTYNIETIGDAYMVTTGLPEPSPLHADTIAAFAVDMIAAASEVMSPVDGRPIEIRVGIHTGKLMAGIMGHLRPRYNIFGDTVNVASRMESTSKPSRIQISTALYQALTNPSAFDLEKRGDIEVKGKGTMSTWWLAAKKTTPAGAPAAQPGARSSARPPRPGEHADSGCGTPMDSPRSSFGSQGSSAPVGQGSSATSNRKVEKSSDDYGSSSPSPLRQGVLVTTKSKTATKAMQPSAFDVDVVCCAGGTRSLCFLPGRTTLGDILGTVAQAAADDDAGRHVKWRLFLDADRKQMLFPTLSLAELYCARKERGLVAEQPSAVTLYLGQDDA